MGFADAVKKGIDNIGNFDGRATRAEFWWFALAVWIVEVILSVLSQTIFSGTIAYIIYYTVYILAWLALLSVGVRRLHDTDKSGWLILLGLICCVGTIILIIFWAQPSQPGDNKYGPQPA